MNYKLRLIILIPLIFISFLIVFRLPVNNSITSLSIEMESVDFTDRFKIFYDIGNGYNEKDSDVKNINKNNKSVRIDFKLPGVKIKNLRIDLGDQLKSIKIKSISLVHDFYRFSYKMRLFSWNAESIFKDFKPINNITEFSESGKILYIKTSGDNPCFINKNDFSNIYNSLDKSGILLLKSLIIAVILLFSVIFYTQINKIISLFTSFINFIKRKNLKDRITGTNIIIIFIMTALFLTILYFNIFFDMLFLFLLFLTAISIGTLFPIKLKFVDKIIVQFTLGLGSLGFLVWITTFYNYHYKILYLLLSCGIIFFRFKVIKEYIIKAKKFVPIIINKNILLFIICSVFLFFYIAAACQLDFPIRCFGKTFSYPF